MVSSTTTALAELGNTVFGGGGQEFAKVDVGDAATVEIVAAVTGSRIRILAAVFAGVGSSTGVILQSNPAGSSATDLTGSIRGATNVSIVLPYNPAGWVQTASGEAFDVTAVVGSVDGLVVYELVPG
jgi:hypothetical protein